MDTIKEELSSDIVSEIGKSEYFNTNLELTFKSSSSSEITEQVASDIQNDFDGGGTLSGVVDQWEWLIFSTRHLITILLDNIISGSTEGVPATAAMEIKMFTDMDVDTISDADDYVDNNSAFYNSNAVGKDFIIDFESNFNRLIIMFKSSTGADLKINSLKIMVKSNELNSEYLRGIEDTTMLIRKYKLTDKKEIQRIIPIQYMMTMTQPHLKYLI